MDTNKQLEDMMKLAMTLSSTNKVEEKLEKNLPEIVLTPLTTEDILSLEEEAGVDKQKFIDNLKPDYSKHLPKISEEKAVKIKSSMRRMSNGATAVVPLQCLGAKCSFSSTCISEYTKILIKDKSKSYKYIQDISPGDTIYSFNTLTGFIEEDNVLQLVYKGIKQTYRIVTDTDIELILTNDHPVYTIVEDEHKWLSIKDGLNIGSVVYLEDSSVWIESETDCDLCVDHIKSIHFDSVRNVYDITVQNNENFFANSVLVHNCPYFLEQAFVLNEPCMVESQLIHLWMTKYLEEFHVDTTSYVDVRLISKLVEYDIYDMRVTKYLASTDQSLLVDFISGYDDAGNEISNKSVSSAFEAKERINNLKSKVLKELMATRESKAKNMATIAQTAGTNSLANTKEVLESLIRTIKANSSKIIDHA